jgi:hypothetical protein
MNGQPPSGFAQPPGAVEPTGPEEPDAPTDPGLGLAAPPDDTSPNPTPEAGEDDLTPRVGTTVVPPPPPDDTVKIDVAAPTPGGMPIAPLPKPKPVVIAERAGEGAWRTGALELKRANDGHYLSLGGGAKHQVIHHTPNNLEQLLGLAQSDHPAGMLWKRLSDIPLERPLPSRQLEEELRVLLNTFANELRQRLTRR